MQNGNILQQIHCNNFPDLMLLFGNTLQYSVLSALFALILRIFQIRLPLIIVILTTPRPGMYILSEAALDFDNCVWTAPSGISDQLKENHSRTKVKEQSPSNESIRRSGRIFCSLAAAFITTLCPIYCINFSCDVTNTDRIFLLERTPGYEQITGCPTGAISSDRL